MSHRKRPVSKKNSSKPIVYSAKTERFYGALVGAAFASVGSVVRSPPIALGTTMFYALVFSLLFLTRLVPRVRFGHRNFKGGMLLGWALYAGLVGAMLILV